MAHHEGNRGPYQGHFDEMLLGIFNALLDGIWNFAGFTQTYPDVAGSITYHNQRPVAKATSALDYLRDTGNLDDRFFQVQPVRVNFRHVLPFLPRACLKSRVQLRGRQRRARQRDHDKCNHRDQIRPARCLPLWPVGRLAGRQREPVVLAGWRRYP